MGERRCVQVVNGHRRPSRRLNLGAHGARDHFDRLIQSGAVSSYSELAPLGGVTRARMTQIMALNRLAADLQERLLFLPRTVSGRAGITERDLRAFVAEVDWARQREMAPPA